MKSPKEEILKRQEELIDEYGDYDSYEVEINEILRDEFHEDKYSEALEELGINDSIEELGLEEDKEDDSIGDDSTTDEEKSNLVRTLLENNKHVYNLYLRLVGYEVLGDKITYTGKQLIPRRDIDFMISVVASLYQPQTLSSKLMHNIKDFDDHMNSTLNQFRKRLAEYSDDICSKNEFRKAIDLFLHEVHTVRNAIMTGRIGDLTRDISNTSYTEKQELSSTDQNIQEARKKLGL
ncbi:MAG: hypothetical protein ACOC56_04830 [Atribacterota bacterium]